MMQPAAGLRLVSLLSIVALLGLPACSRISAGASPAEATIEPPERRADRLPAVELAPPLPPAAATLTPTTFRFVEERHSPNTSARTTLERIVTRGAGGIHVRTAGAHGEWLFRQNPVDPTRVSAAYADHRTRTIVEYEETDLRIALNVRGWLDVLTTPMRPGVLETMQPTGGHRQAHGLVFQHYRDTRPDHSAVEAWWSPEALVAAEFIVNDGGVRTRTRLVGLDSAIDESLLAPLADRFPEYQIRGLDDDWKSH